MVLSLIVSVMLVVLKVRHGAVTDRLSHVGRVAPALPDTGISIHVSCITGAAKTYTNKYESNWNTSF